MAKRLKLTRSELYARALKEMVRRYDDAEITRRLNEVYGPNGEGSELDPVWELALLEVLRGSEWK